MGILLFEISTEQVFQYYQDCMTEIQFYQIMGSDVKQTPVKRMILNGVKGQEISVEDAIKLADVYDGLTALNKQEFAVKMKKDNINDLEGFKKALTEYVDTLNQGMEMIDNDTLKVYEDDEWYVISPLTAEASRKHCSESAWCTASSSYAYYFPRYTISKEACLIAFFNKKGANKTFQIAIDKDRYINNICDVRDKPLDSPLQMIDEGLYNRIVTQEVLDFAIRKTREKANSHGSRIDYGRMPIKTLLRLYRLSEQNNDDGTVRDVAGVLRVCAIADNRFNVVYKYSNEEMKYIVDDNYNFIFPYPFRTVKAASYELARLFEEHNAHDMLYFVDRGTEGNNILILNEETNEKRFLIQGNEWAHSQIIPFKIASRNGETTYGFCYQTKNGEHVNVDFDGNPININVTIVDEDAVLQRGEFNLPEADAVVRLGEQVSLDTYGGNSYLYIKFNKASEPNFYKWDAFTTYFYENYLYLSNSEEQAEYMVQMAFLSIFEKCPDLRDFNGRFDGFVRKIEGVEWGCTYIGRTLNIAVMANGNVRLFQCRTIARFSTDSDTHMPFTLPDGSKVMAAIHGVYDNDTLNYIGIKPNGEPGMLIDGGFTKEDIKDKINYCGVTFSLIKLKNGGHIVYNVKDEKGVNLDFNNLKNVDGMIVYLYKKMDTEAFGEVYNGANILAGETQKHKQKTVTGNISLVKDEDGGLKVLTNAEGNATVTMISENAAFLRGEDYEQLVEFHGGKPVVMYTITPGENFILSTSPLQKTADNTGGDEIFTFISLPATEKIKSISGDNDKSFPLTFSYSTKNSFHVTMVGNNASNFYLNRLSQGNLNGKENIYAVLSSPKDNIEDYGYGEDEMGALIWNKKIPLEEYVNAYFEAFTQWEGIQINPLFIKKIKDDFNNIIKMAAVEEPSAEEIKQMVQEAVRRILNRM